MGEEGGEREGEGRGGGEAGRQAGRQAGKQAKGGSETDPTDHPCQRVALTQRVALVFSQRGGRQSRQRMCSQRSAHHTLRAK